MDQTVDALLAAARANAGKLSDFTEPALRDAVLRRDTVIVFVEAGATLDLGSDAVMLFQDDNRQAWAAPANGSRLAEWLSHRQVLSICRNDLPDMKLLHEPC